MSTLSISPAFAPTRATRRSTLRLTRRGRLVVFLGALSLLLVAAVFAGSVAVGTDESGRPAPTEIIQVAPGDTLWEIASGISSDGDVTDMMAKIQDLNALDGVDLAAGQRLRIPVSTD